MIQRRVVLALAAVLLLAAAPKPSAKKRATPASPKPAAHATSVAPEFVPHDIAMFLAGLCKDGERNINFKASALGTHFFVEEPGGVTVYLFQGSSYRRDVFLPGATLRNAIKRFEPVTKK
jgi:hypothetical protein